MIFNLFAAYAAKGVYMKTITMYSSNVCPRCSEAKSFLGKKGYSFIERDVRTDKAAQQELRDMYASGFPTFVIGNKIIEGFDTRAIEAAMGE